MGINPGDVSGRTTGNPRQLEHISIVASARVEELSTTAIRPQMVCVSQRTLSKLQPYLSIFFLVFKRMRYQQDVCTVKKERYIYI